MTGETEAVTPSTTDYRLTRVEREVAELRAKIESGQGAMLQAVAGVQTQLATFQIGLQTDLNTRFVSQKEAEENRREMRERIDGASRRLDDFDKRYIQALEDARKLAETRRGEDAERTFRVNLALFMATASAITAVAVHFIKLPV